MALVKKSTPSLKPTVNSKITTTAVGKPVVKPSTIIKKSTVTPKTSPSEGIAAVKSTSSPKSTLPSAVSPASAKMTTKPSALTPRPLKVTVPVKQAADSTSPLKAKSAVKPTGKTPSVLVKAGVPAKPISKVTTAASPVKAAPTVKKSAVPAVKPTRVANEESVGPKTKPAITTKVSTLKSPTPSSTPVKARSMSITSVKSSLAPKTTKPVSANKSPTSTTVKSSTKLTPPPPSKSTKSIVGPKTTLKQSNAIKSVSKVVSPPVTKTEKPADEIKQQEDATLVEIRDADSTTIEEVVYMPKDSEKCDENGNFEQESEVDEERVYAVAEQLIMMQQLHKDSYVINMSGIEMEETSVPLNTTEPSATIPSEATKEKLSDEEQTASLDTLASQLPTETDTTTEEEKEKMLEIYESEIQGIADNYQDVSHIFEEMVKANDEHIEENNTDLSEDCKAVNSAEENAEFSPSPVTEEDAEGLSEQDIIAAEELVGQDFPNEETNLLEESFPTFNAEMIPNSSETNAKDFSKNEEVDLQEEFPPIPFNAQMTESLTKISVVSCAASFLDETKFENSIELAVIGTKELVEMNEVPNSSIENTGNSEVVLDTNDDLQSAIESKYEQMDEESPSSIVDIPVHDDSAKDEEESLNTGVVDCVSTLLDSVCEKSSNNETLPLIEISENSSASMPESTLIEFADQDSGDNHSAVVQESCNKEEPTCTDFLFDSHFSVTNISITAGPTDLDIFNTEQSNGGSCPTVEHDKNENFMVFGNFEDVIGMSYAEALTVPKNPGDNSLEVMEGVNTDDENVIQSHPVHTEEKIDDPIDEVVLINQAEKSSIPIYSVYDNAEFPDAVPSDEHYEKQDHEQEGDQHEESFHKIRHKRNKRRNKKNRKSSNAENFDEDSPNKVHTEKPDHQPSEYYHGRRRNSRRWRNSRAYYEAFHQPQQAQYQEYYRDSHWKYSDAKMD